MNRRYFLNGAAVVALYSSSASAFPNKFGNKILDCGPGDSKACAFEREGAKKRAAAHNKWIVKAKAEANVIIAANSRYDYSRVVLNTKDVVKLISGGTFDSDHRDYNLVVSIVPLAPQNGKAPEVVTATIWRKSGWGRNKDVAKNISYRPLIAKGRRTYKVGGFTGPCVVLFNKSAIGRIGGDLPPGCYPANSPQCNPNRT